MPAKKQDPMKLYVAEAVATFFLALTVSLTLIFNLSIATAVAAGLTLGLFVYTIGHLSGAHLNPAVSIGLWSVGKMSGHEAFMYVLAQLFGGIVAMVSVTTVFGSGPELVVEKDLFTGLGEALGAFILVFGICSVVYGKVSDGAAGVVIGGSLTLGAILGSSLSNGVVNPAVALGIGSLSVMYVFGPIAGGIAAAWVYRWMNS